MCEARMLRSNECAKARMSEGRMLRSNECAKARMSEGRMLTLSTNAGGECLAT